MTVANVRSMVSKQNRDQVEQAEGAPCSCDDRGGVCGWHYALLDDRQRFLVRERAGIAGVARGRVAGQVGSRRG